MGTPLVARTAAFRSARPLSAILGHGLLNAINYRPPVTAYRSAGAIKTEAISLLADRAARCALKRSPICMPRGLAVIYELSISVSAIPDSRIGNDARPN